MLATYRSLIGADPDEFDSARDDDGHGTHTASTSAGNAGVEAEIYGIPAVPSPELPHERTLLLTRVWAIWAVFSSDLAAAIDQAVADGVDVINYSIGGGASLDGADDIAFLFAMPPVSSRPPLPATPVPELPRSAAGFGALGHYRRGQHPAPFLQRFYHDRRRQV